MWTDHLFLVGLEEANAVTSALASQWEDDDDQEFRMKGNVPAKGTGTY